MLKIHNFKYIEDKHKLDIIASTLDRQKELSDEIERKGVLITDKDGKFYKNPALSGEIEQKKAYFELIGLLFE